MLRLLLPAVAALALVLAACGDDDDGPAGGFSAAGSPSASAADNTAVPNQQPTPDRPLPTATPASDKAVALSIAAGEKHYNPTVAEFRALPTTEIDAGGPQKGVLLNDLAAKVGGQPDAFVSIQGYRNDLKTLAFVRKRLSEIGSNTVLSIDDQGHVNLASSALPQIEWLKAVSVIGFQQ